MTYPGGLHLEIRVTLGEEFLLAGVCVFLGGGDWVGVSRAFSDWEHGEVDGGSVFREVMSDDSRYDEALSEDQFRRFFH